MVLAIQVITVFWTKSGRASPVAARRNQIPRAFELRRHGGSLNVIQRHAFHETASGDFSSHPPSCGRAPNPLKGIDGLMLDHAGEGLSIGFWWDLGVHGMPYRNCSRRLVELKPGESVQLRVNGRHSGEGHWYTQHTFNVAYAPRLHERVFLDRDFTHAVSLEENLF